MSTYIFGAGGFGREVFSYMNKSELAKFAGFIDKDIQQSVNDSNKIYSIDKFSENIYNKAIIAVGDSHLRQKIVKQIMNLAGIHEPTFIKFDKVISKKALIGDNCDYGVGCIFAPGSIVTVNVKLGNFVNLNLHSDIGHDAILGDYCTLAPGARISGKVNSGKNVYFGTNSCVIEGISICDNVIIGAGAVVTKDIIQPGVYVGVPARQLKAS